MYDKLKLMVGAVSQARQFHSEWQTQHKRKTEWWLKSPLMWPMVNTIGEFEYIGFHDRQLTAMPCGHGHLNVQYLGCAKHDRFVLYPSTGGSGM